MQAHEFSVPSEILTELKLMLTYCMNCHTSVALSCPSTLSEIPSTILDYPGYFLCRFNPSFYVAKIVKCDNHIKKHTNLNKNLLNFQSQGLNLTANKRDSNKIDL